MKRIFKFQLNPVGSVCVIQLPADAVVTRIGVQDGSMYAWVMSDVYAPCNVPMEFLVVGTGDAISDGFEPISTFNDGPFVWHGLVRAPVPYIPSRIPA